MRFENSAFERGGVDAFDLDDLRCCGEAGYDSNCRWGNGSDFRQETDDRFVSLSIHRRCGHAEFPGISESSHELCFGGSGADFKSEARLHEPRIFAS